MDDTLTAAERDTLHDRYSKCVANGAREEAEQIARPLGLADAQVEAHFLARRHTDDDWLPESFEDFEALPPGRFDSRVFDQSIWWVDMLRQPHRIADPEQLTDEHLHAVLAFVYQEGWRWIDAPDTNETSFSVESFRDSLRRAIQTTPLVSALHAESERRASASTVTSSA